MGTLRMRVERLKTEFAWAEDPPSRTRRFVTNVRPRVVAEGVDVRSYLLLYRSRGDATTAELVSAERHDLFQRTATGLRLQRREVLIDQASLAVRNLAVML
jgi:3-phenylpropionate/cinnamic acid dioxygenase small subunit